MRDDASRAHPPCGGFLIVVAPAPVFYIGVFTFLLLLLSHTLAFCMGEGLFYPLRFPT